MSTRTGARVGRGVAGLSANGAKCMYEEYGVGWAEIREVL